jgi:hypothetical protein
VNNFGEKVSFIWSVADLLRGPVFEDLIRRFNEQPTRPPATTSPRARSSA